MSYNHDSAIHQRVQAGSQKRGKENNSETQPSSTFHKDDILTSSAVLLDKNLRKNIGKVCYIYPKEGKLQEEANSTPRQ
jgi:hypothetical protein